MTSIPLGPFLSAMELGKSLFEPTFGSWGTKPTSNSAANGEQIERCIERETFRKEEEEEE
jgi:hypothetical protein